MKSLKPSAREKKRYLHVKGENLKDEIPNSILEFIGVYGASKVGLSFIKDNKSSTVISINREMLDSVRASFCAYSKKIEVVKVSGTLKALGFSANRK